MSAKHIPHIECPTGDLRCFFTTCRYFGLMERRRVRHAPVGSCPFRLMVVVQVCPEYLPNVGSSLTHVLVSISAVLDMRLWRETGKEVGINRL